MHSATIPFCCKISSHLRTSSNRGTLFEDPHTKIPGFKSSRKNVHKIGGKRDVDKVNSAIEFRRGRVVVVDFLCLLAMCKVPVDVLDGRKLVLHLASSYSFSSLHSTKRLGILGV